MNDMQPGQVIIPHNSDNPKPPGDGGPEPDRPLEEAGPDLPTAPNPGPEPVRTVESASQMDTPPTPDPAPAPGPEASWQFNAAPSTPDAQPPPDNMNWTASEFIAHEKSAQWYAGLVAIGLVAAVLDYLLTRDKFSTGVIVFAVVVFGAFAARRPRTQEYALTHQSLQIGLKSYYFKDFKNFSVIEEGAIASIVFMPLKRFMPPLTIYVSPDMEDQVMSFLSDILPFEQHRADAVDSLLRRIHF